MSKVPEHRKSCSKIQSPNRKIRTKDDDERLKLSQKRLKTQQVEHKNEVQTLKIHNDDPLEQLLEEKTDSSLESVLSKINSDLGGNSVQNPRIQDLRNKLNEIKKKSENRVDKPENISCHETQLTDDDSCRDSGPYSLIFDFQNQNESSNISDSVELVGVKSELCKVEIDKSAEKSSSNISSQGERKPNLVNFEELNASEFEYSCSTASTATASEKSSRNARSGLCLHFTNSTKSNKSELSPLTNNSLLRPNDEHSLDDSLGILTPDQMDDMFSPTVEELPVFGNELKSSPDNGETPSTEKTETNSPVSTMYVEQDLQGAESLTFASILTEDSHNTPAQSDIKEDLNSTNFSIRSHCENSIIDLEESELQFGESDSKELLHEKENDNVPDNIFVPNTNDEFLLSVSSSILEPASLTINLDLPLDTNNFKELKNHLSERIDQTPSPEDLPLDGTESNEHTTLSHSIASPAPLVDSQISETKTDLPKSMESSKVSSIFITSITSITSLDGYQGDGEMSRPVSRGGEQSGIKDDPLEMNWQNVPVNRRQDPMTDSDFFTESDADGHEDQIHRGDRRAQVIDGALYGGTNHSPPLIVNRNDDSCMDSSGVYTDLENHRCSPVFLNTIEDMSPDGSSPSTHSECSQKSSNNKGAMSTAENSSIKSNSTQAGTANERKSQKNTGSDVKTEKPKEEKKSFSLKKYKMPKRDVPSKLKIMLSRKPDSDTSSENSPLSKTKKTERREVTSRKLNGEGKVKNFKDIKSKVDCSFSLQRSQTACNVSRMINTSTPKPKTRHLRSRVSEPVGRSGKSSLHSSQSDLSSPPKPPARFPARATKKRESVPGGAGVTSPRASAPAAPHTPPSHGKKVGSGLPTPTTPLPKLSGSPVSPRPRPAPASAPAQVSTPAPAPAPSPAPAPAAARKPQQRRLTTPARPNTLPSSVKDPVRCGSVRSSKRVGNQPAAPGQPVPAPAPAPRTPPPAQAALAHASKGVEALAVLVQYLVCQLEVVSGEGWRAEAARWRGVAAAERAAAARAAHDHTQRAQKDLDTIEECLSKISQLEMEASRHEEASARLADAARRAEERYADTLRDVAALKQEIAALKSTIGQLKECVAGSAARAGEAAAERARELSAQLSAARADLARAHHERLPELDKDKTELVAEVRSLRAVLELKQAEGGELRQTRSLLLAESERRLAAERELAALRQAGEELRERAAARQTDADALRDENRRLRAGAVRDQQAHARLTLANEELRYKLRQKSQVASLLATGGCGSPRARAASCSSPPDSPSPSASPSPPAPPDSPSRSPAVKGVVEKHDSVSWVLEIEESPEEVADRIARRSNSFRSPGSGVKRRGGGSPASPQPASPAPTSKLFRCSGDRAPDLSAPPLKESAGEAIYIYDNRQF